MKNVPLCQASQWQSRGKEGEGGKERGWERKNEEVTAVATVTDMFLPGSRFPRVIIKAICRGSVGRVASTDVCIPASRKPTSWERLTKAGALTTHTGTQKTSTDSLVRPNVWHTLANPPVSVYWVCSDSFAFSKITRCTQANKESVSTFQRSLLCPGGQREGEAGDGLLTEHVLGTCLSTSLNVWDC